MNIPEPYNESDAIAAYEKLVSELTERLDYARLLAGIGRTPLTIGGWYFATRAGLVVLPKYHFDEHHEKRFRYCAKHGITLEEFQTEHWQTMFALEYPEAGE